MAGELDDWSFNDNSISDEIKYFFALDTWNIDQASMLLAGIAPVAAGLLGNYMLNGRLLDGAPDRDELLEKMRRYEKLWISNTANSSIAKPEDFIRWAIHKGFPPRWLGEAIKCGYYSNENADQSFDRNLNAKSEGAYLNIIGAMLGIILNKVDVDNVRFSRIKDQSELIQAIHENFGDTNGLSMSNLQKKFADAKKSISSK